MRRWIGLAAVLTLTGCGVVQRTRQVRTYADMQTICAKVSRARPGDPLRAIQEAAESVAKGRDAWGNPFVWHVEVRSNNFSYVLISYGSDGRPDLTNEAAYFGLHDYRVRADPRKDIVFVDGESVTDAGK